jgi:hypothetical protein
MNYATTPRNSDNLAAQLIARDRVYAAKNPAMIKVVHRTRLYSCHGRRVSLAVVRVVLLLHMLAFDGTLIMCCTL